MSFWKFDFGWYCQFCLKNYYYFLLMYRKICWPYGEKPHKISCYASLHVCDTLCCAYFYVNTHFETFVYELSIEHTPITAILIEHRLISRIYLISVLERKSTTYEVFLPMLHSTSVAFSSGTYKDCQYFKWKSLENNILNTTFWSKHNLIRSLICAFIT